MSTSDITRPARDPRLDFFRGLAMFIIIVAHTPDNPWAHATPGRFGFSDATEIFVFCSGMASAIAFGRIFARRGWLFGAVRILHRTWQIYWAHVGTFVLIAALMVALDAARITEHIYVGELNLVPFFRDPAAGLLGLMTLTYVPNYFDILPMYLVVLAMIPIVVALAGIHRSAAGVAIVALWLAANLGQIGLPAEPWSDRPWFFNPFGWQLLFFLGFAFASGWLRPPPVNAVVLVLAALVVLASVPVAHFGLREALGLGELRADLVPLVGKTPFGPLRLLHFLAIAYLAFVLVGPDGARLARGRVWPRFVCAVMIVGRQSLAIFIFGLVLSRLLGVALDILGRDPLTAALVNVAGVAIVLAVAVFVTWIKGEPWRAVDPR